MRGWGNRCVVVVGVGGNGRLPARGARVSLPFRPTPFSRIIEPTKTDLFWLVEDGYW
jgi:hypothetical protein